MRSDIRGMEAEVSLLHNSCMIEVSFRVHNAKVKIKLRSHKSIEAKSLCVENNKMTRTQQKASLSLTTLR